MVMPVTCTDEVWFLHRNLFFILTLQELIALPESSRWISDVSHEHSYGSPLVHGVWVVRQTVFRQ